MWVCMFVYVGLLAYVCGSVSSWSCICMRLSVCRLGLISMGACILLRAWMVGSCLGLDLGATPGFIAL